MLQFFIKRLVGLIFVVFGVTLITFIMGYFAPGDPILSLMGDKYNEAIYLRLRHDYGLDLPFYEQYFRFLTNMLQFNFGLSYFYKGRQVWDILKEGVPISMELVLWGFLLQLVLGIPLGILSALKAGTWVDTTNMAIMLIVFALPNFVLAVLVQVIILKINQMTEGQWPVTQWGDPWNYGWENLQYKIAPIITFGAAGFAYFSRLTRTSVLEVLGQDFVRTARAKGLRGNVIVYRHVFRNALIPLVTVIGLTLGLLVVGSFFIESIFNIPGIARITVNSIAQRDYPVIQATTILIAVGVVLGNLVSDLLYSVVDPRIRIQ